MGDKSEGFPCFCGERALHFVRLGGLVAHPPKEPKSSSSRDLLRNLSITILLEPLGGALGAGVAHSVPLVIEPYRLLYRCGIFNSSLYL